MPVSPNPLATLKRYELVAEVLRSNILSGRLPRGFVLMEGPISERMQTSRAPVQAALRALEDEGHIHRLSGRGYMVGFADADLSQVRSDIRKIKLHIAPEIADALATRGTWQHFYEKVEREVAACLIFGEFRIFEAELATYLGVSRTVARDILGRLHERGLIRKTQSSHWTAGPLTARDIRERFELRAILEPEALRQAAPHIDYESIARIGRAMPEKGAVDNEYLEDALFEGCVARAPNAELVYVIRKARFLPHAANRALTELGLPKDPITREEYCSLFELLARQRIASAAEELRTHIDLMARKSLARLKIVSVIGKSTAIAPYLREI